MYYIGLDVHKQTIGYCVKDAASRVCLERKNPFLPSMHPPPSEGLRNIHIGYRTGFKSRSREDIGSQKGTVQTGHDGSGSESSPRSLPEPSGAVLECGELSGAGTETAFQHLPVKIYM